MSGSLSPVYGLVVHAICVPCPQQPYNSFSFRLPYQDRPPAHPLALAPLALPPACRGTMRRLSGPQICCYHPDNRTNTRQFFPFKIPPLFGFHIRDLLRISDRSQTRYQNFRFPDMFEIMITHTVVFCKDFNTVIPV